MKKKKSLSRDRGEINMGRETAYIVKKAQQLDSRLVEFGSLLLFSTQTGDAWMLDPSDGLALCLALDGVKQPFVVEDTADHFSIHWNGHYKIKDDAFVVAYDDGRKIGYFGYPVREIRATADSSRGKRPFIGVVILQASAVVRSFINTCRKFGKSYGDK